MAPIYAGLGQTESTNYQFAAQEALLDGDVSRRVKVLKCFFANIPYSLAEVTKLGLSFSSEKRTIVDWQAVRRKKVRLAG